MEKINKIINCLKSSERTKIDTTDWKEFKLSEIFEKTETGSDIIKNQVNGNKISLISSCEGNNGVAKLVDDCKKLFSGNKLTLAKNGSVGTIYYQPQDFCATSDIMILSNVNLNCNISLFIKSVAEKQTKKYNWGNKINMEKYNKISIFLPSKNNQPDWEYMDKFIENLRNKLHLNQSSIPPATNCNNE